MSTAPSDNDDLDPILIELRNHRRRLHMSQEELAIRAGVTASRVGQWERGLYAIQLSSLRRWADALGVGLTTKRKRRDGT